MATTATTVLASQSRPPRLPLPPPGAVAPPSPTRRGLPGRPRGTMVSPRVCLPPPQDRIMAQRRSTGRSTVIAGRRRGPGRGLGGRAMTAMRRWRGGAGRARPGGTDTGVTTVALDILRRDRLRDRWGVSGVVDTVVGDKTDGARVFRVSAFTGEMMAVRVVTSCDGLLGRVCFPAQMVRCFREGNVPPYPRPPRTFSPPPVCVCV